MLVIFIMGIFLARFAASSSHLMSLDGNEWTVTNSNGSIRIGANVPGGIYTDLQRNSVIGDPYFRFNDIEYRWIALENWTYSRFFEVSEDVLSKERVVLICHGLDTVAEIIINGHYLNSTNNMFVRYIFDIKDTIHVGQNEIEIRFMSAVEYAKAKHLEHLQKYVVPPTCPPPVQNGECHANFIRKIQSSFSWDWGPSFPSQGIWKKIVIESYNSASIQDLTAFTSLEKNNGENTWNIQTNIFLERSFASNGGNLEVKLDNSILATNPIVFHDKSLLNVSFTINVTLPKKIPIELWWPSGYGNQKLYNLTVTYTDGQTTEVSRLTKRIGFRTIELVQDNVTQSGVSGQTFYFRINNVSVFAKGSNMIPLDSFPERVTPSYVRWLMQSTVDANMNMLRIWGGGMYENDLIYEAADELGILIWQDFMFACALYPVDDDFLLTVTNEVTQQVRRLQTHPSVCLWSGNNENEGAIAQYWWPLHNPDQYIADYKKLYVDTILAVVDKEDPTRPFLTSSPTNGLPSERAGEIDENPGNELYGDVHFYSYSSDGWDWTTYPRPRFASEYGFQSFPSFESLANVSVATDWTFPTSSFLEQRQHHTSGNLEMQISIRRQFVLPPEPTGVKGFSDFLYLTQVVQAMSVKTETEHYRRSKSELVEGKGYTMGALYWQLNDIWQGASWASIEFGGKWKMLHYFAKEFFAPILVSPYIDEDVVKTSVVSDFTHSVKLNLIISVYDWSSFTTKYNTTIPFQQKAQSAQVISEIPVADLLSAANCQSAKSCFFYFRLFASENKNILSTNFIVPTQFKNAVGLSKANIQIKDIQQVDSRRFYITLESDRIAPFVWLDTPGILGNFSRNGFLMVDPTVSLNFTSTQDLTLIELSQVLNVQSLMETQTVNIFEKLKDDLISVLLNQE